MIDRERIIKSCQNISASCVPWKVENGKNIQLPPNPKIETWSYDLDTADVIIIDKQVDFKRLKEQMPAWGKAYSVLEDPEDLWYFKSRKFPAIDVRIIDGKCHAIFRKMRQFDVQHWEGQPGRLLIHCEGGYGDFFHAVRYRPYIKNHVTFEVRPELYRLFKECTEFEEIIIKGEPYNVDYRIPAGRLTKMFGKHLLKGYIKKPEVCPQIEYTDKIKIGFVYEGQHFKFGPIRRYPLKSMRQLALPNVQLYRFQKHSDYERELEQGDFFIDLSDKINDWYDTAIYLCQMDLLVAPDTGIVHLSGALGIPVAAVLHPTHLNAFMDIHRSFDYTCVKLYPNIESVVTALIAASSF